MPIRLSQARFGSGVTYDYPPEPTTSAQRMRDLRRRNPDYDRQYKARRRAEYEAQLAAIEAKRAAALAAMLAPTKPVLMLPAPVVDPAMEALKALAMKLNRQCVAA